VEECVHAVVNTVDASEVRLRDLNSGCLTSSDGFCEDRSGLPREISTHDCH
jgi:hypothetical protein